MAEPVSESQAEKAAIAIILARRPAQDPGQIRTAGATGGSDRAVKKVSPFLRAGRKVGYVAELEPRGYVLMGADNDAPAVKLFSHDGTFQDLPPGFVEVLKLEQAEDLAVLEELRAKHQPPTSQFRSEWMRLLEAGTPNTGFAAAASTETSEPPLLATTWNQGEPYNLYCPAASGGPGERAVTGCGAIGLAQILRYYRQPGQALRDWSYTDTTGACTGVRSLSEAGMTPYLWDKMPLALATSSPEEEQRAVAQLIYHAAVALVSSFEASETTVVCSAARNALLSCFGYECSEFETQIYYSSVAWYAQIAADIAARRPVFYAMWPADESTGHIAVCDGCRNGNEIHLNLGWGGAGNAWYNIASVRSGGYTWTLHGAVFGITPPLSPTLAAPHLVQEPPITLGTENTIGWQPLVEFGLNSLSVQAAPPASIRGRVSLPPAESMARRPLQARTESTAPMLETAWASDWNGVFLPNLTAYHYPDWSDVIVISTTLGTHQDSAVFTPSDALYLDLAVVNNGPTVTFDGFYIDFYFDGVLTGYLWADPYLESGWVRIWEDVELGSFEPGTHLLQIDIDGDDSVLEITETDNAVERFFTVQGTGQPNLTPYGPSSWSDKIVVSTMPGNFMDNSPLFDTDPLYVDCAVANLGTGSTAGPFTIQLLVDGVPVRDWPLEAPVEAYYYWEVDDVALGPLSPGSHSLTLRADPTGAITELNEGDNEYTRTISIASRPVIEYQVQCSYDPGFTSPQTSEWTTALNYTFSNLSMGCSYWYRVRARQNLIETPWSGVETSRQEPTYAAWLASAFSAAELNTPTLEVSRWGVSADPDGDGCPNLLEYALGLDPNQSEDAGDRLTTTAGGSQGDRLRLCVRRRTADPTLQYVVEVSSDLRTWQSGPEVVTEISNSPIVEDPAFSTTEYEDKVPVTVAGPRFIRLRLTRQ